MNSKPLKNKPKTPNRIRSGEIVVRGCKYINVCGQPLNLSALANRMAEDFRDRYNWPDPE